MQIVDVVSGDSIVDAHDFASYGIPLGQHWVNWSRVRAPKINNPRRYEKPDPYLREANVCLCRKRIGKEPCSTV